MSSQPAPRIPLPEGWNKHVRLSLLHVISPTQFADACTHGWNADSTTLRLRRKTELLCLTATIVLDSNRSESDRKPWLSLVQRRTQLANQTKPALKIRAVTIDAKRY